VGVIKIGDLVIKKPYLFILPDLVETCIHNRHNVAGNIWTPTTLVGVATGDLYATNA